ncbi:Atxe2 family lasso peptide isopeptidase [Sphingopyxis sp. LARHCG72]
MMTAALALVAASPTPALQEIERLTEVADISGLAASPDGQWIAYRIERPSIARNLIDAHWYIVAADGQSPPRHVGSGGHATWDSAGVIEPGHAVWMPDSASFLVRAERDGRTGLWSMRVAGPPAPAFAADGDIERFAVTRKGAIIAEIGPPRDAVRRADSEARDRGVLMDEQVNLAGGIYHDAMTGNETISERWTGQWFDSAPLLWNDPRRVVAYDPNAGTDAVAVAAERALLDAAAPAPPEDAIAAAIAATECDRPMLRCDRPRLSSSLPLGDGRWAVTTIDDGLGQRIHVWDDRRKRLQLVRAARGLLNGGRRERSRCAAAENALFCVEAAADQPPRLVRLRFDGGPLQVIAAPNKNLARDRLIVEPVAWRVGDSRASGWLLRPNIPGRLPLFITYYRCAGYLRGGLGDEWPLRALALSGMAALCINALPVSDESAERRYDTGLEAVRTAIEMLDRKGRIDRGRIGMGGLSFGSEVTMWIAARSNLLRAASIASVQIEPAYYWFNIIADKGRFRENFKKQWGLGPPDEDRELWKRLSPAANVAKIEAPILLQLPEKEARLSPELHARLIAARKGELHIFPLAPHIKAAPRQKWAAYARNLDWFRYWLQGQIDPDPAKADQYARWAALAPPRQRHDSTDRTQRSISAISSSRK